MPYTFDAIQAFDPTNPKIVAADAEIIIHAPDDPSLTPIEITDVTGLALPNPYLTNDLGSMPAFVADVERVAWTSGDMTNFLTSWEGLRDAAEAAAVSAGEAAATAVDAVQDQLEDYIGSVEASKMAAEAAAVSAATSAGLVDAPAGEAVKAAIGPGGAAEQDLNAIVDGRTGDGSESDFVNSWWCVPRSVYNDLRGCFYQGGVTREGMMRVAKFDLRRKTIDKIDLGLYEKDDHNVPAILFEDDKPPMVAVVRHAVEKFVRVRVGTSPHDLHSLAEAPEIKVPFPAACTYAHLIRRPTDDVVALLTRLADGWHVSVSRDWGVTWEPARRFHGMGYGTFRLVGHLVHYAVTNHPVSVPNNTIRYFKIDTVSGDVTTAHSEVAIGNLWTGTEVIAANSMTVVIQSYDPDTNRTFDIGRGGSIAAMKFDKTRPEVGGIYGIYRHKAGGAWDWEPIVASGVPVGYYQSSYVGGMGFGGNDDSVWLCREVEGKWVTERWVKSAGFWAPSETIETRDGLQMGRPQVPWGAEGTGLFAHIDYWRYEPDTFADYYGDQRWAKTGIVEAVIREPELPAVSPLPDPIVPQELITTGSLLLVDPKHPEGAWPGGVPSGTVRNLAGGTLAVANDLGGGGAAERTAKGGLHVAMSQTSSAQGNVFTLNAPSVAAHLKANPSHGYFISLWAVASRYPDRNPPIQLQRFFGVLAPTNGDSMSVRMTTGYRATVAASSGRTNFKETATPMPLNEVQRINAAYSSIVTPGDNVAILFWGDDNELTVNQAPSWILYRAYLEDLTESGRTYAEVDTIDTAEYVRAFNPGGRYGDDSWTAPGTLAP